MDYLADTVAIVRHLRRHPDLGQQARLILTEADQGNFWSLVLSSYMSIHGYLAHHAMTDA
jgi:hypothetical protein